jgi:hypothetical protein
MANPSRLWSDIARELARETNRTRILELSKELDAALREQVLSQPEPQSGIDALKKAAEDSRNGKQAP